MMRRPASRTLWALAIVPPLLVSGVVVRTQRTLAEFTKGELQFNQEGTPYAIPLLKPGSSLNAYGTKNTWAINLTYRASARPGMIAQSVRFVLTDVSGPGRYGKPNIQTFVFETEDAVWRFDNKRDDCIFVLTRAGQSAIEGTVTCAETGGEAPFSDMKFIAAR